MNAAPTALSVFRHAMGSAYNRQICVNERNATAKVQQPLRGSFLPRYRCVVSIGLGFRKRLRQRTAGVIEFGYTNYRNTASNSNGYSTQVARKMVEPKAESTFHSTTDKTTECKRILHRQKYFNSATEEKYKVGMARLEDMWANSLRKNAWEKTCIAKYPAF